MEASDDNTTTYDYQTDITTTYDYQSDIVTTSTNITEELFINITNSTLFGNNSCYPNCYTIFKPHRVNVDFIIGITCLFLVVIFLITTGTVVFLRHHQQSKKQQKKEKEYLQVKRYLCLMEDRMFVLG